eukprot:TRINITY_DN3653_c0_g1_i1.p1 TRINITY_DN3653_c0_g1~~TRINITY_DN3653_c0_g1_i1.p1  ORF type:complete len:1168 (-),score=259.25 TRINITY_DN3653_c0_g1_i1:226-3597(-)
MQDITIPSGTSILLDVSPPLMHYLKIEGDLIFDERNLTLDAHFIYLMNGGHLWIGSEDCNYISTSTVTLHGDWSNLPFEGMGSKVLGVYPGTQLDIHGSVRKPTWTRLGETAVKGSDRITLLEPVEWQIGDEIVIASTDFEYSDRQQHERRTITDKPAINVVVLNEPLEYNHWGQTVQVNDRTIEMRAEVGLLTRNIKFIGDTSGDSGARGWGGHLMIAPQTEARIRGAEFIHMGQNGTLARYPIHFHVAGNHSKSYVKDNSVHDTFQRCITLHGVNYVTVSWNVAYNSAGHCFFIEDGNEQQNTLTYNLAIHARPHTLLAHDVRPSMFWITNPSNNFVGNVAVGGSVGFWFSLPQHPKGLANPNLAWQDWPQYSELGLFINNLAHSNIENGLEFDRGLLDNNGNLEEKTLYAPRDTYFVLNSVLTGADQLALADINTAMYYSNNVPAVVDGFTAYKCRRYAIYARSDSLVIHEGQLADSGIGIGLSGYGCVVQGTLIVGETDNVGTPAKDSEQGRSRIDTNKLSLGIFGIEINEDSKANLFNKIAFYNYQNEQIQSVTRPSGAITIQDGNGVASPTNKFFNLEFNSVANKVYLQSNLYSPATANGHLTGVIVDNDGTITGTCGNFVISDKNSLVGAGCNTNPAWNATVCQNQAVLRQVQFKDEAANTLQQSVNNLLGTIIDIDSQSVIKLAAHDARPKPLTDLSQDTAGSNTPFNQQLAYSANLKIGSNYLMAFGGSKTPAQVRVSLLGSLAGEWIRVGIPYPAETTFGVADSTGVTFTEATALDTLTRNTFYFDTTQNILWLIVSAPTSQFSWHWGLSFPSGEYSVFVTASCADNCAVPALTTNNLPTLPQLPAPTSVSYCENSGPYPLNGQVVLTTVENGQVHNVFMEQFENTWNAIGTAWSISNEVTAFEGSQELKFSTDVNQIFAMTITDGAQAVNIDNFSHLSISAQLGALDGYKSLMIGLSSAAAPNDIFWTHTSNPRYGLNQPVTNSGWATFNIPLSDFNMAPGTLVGSISIKINEPVPIRTAYLDKIQFASYQSQIQAIDSYSVSAVYTVIENPYPFEPTPVPGSPSSNPGSPNTTPQTPIDDPNNNQPSTSHAVPLTPKFVFALIVFVICLAL